MLGLCISINCVTLGTLTSSAHRRPTQVSDTCQISKVHSHNSPQTQRRLIHNRTQSSVHCTKQEIPQVSAAPTS